MNKKLFHGVLLSLLACGLAAAQSSDQSPWFAQMGIARTPSGMTYTRTVRGASVSTVLTPAQTGRVDDFDHQLETSPSGADSILYTKVMQAIEAAGVTPDAPTPDGTVWFKKGPAGLQLTEDGRKAVPGILIGQTFGASQASAQASAPGAAAVPSRMQGLTAGIANANFDGSNQNGAAPVVQAPGMGTVRGSGLTAPTAVGGPSANVPTLTAALPAIPADPAAKPASESWGEKILDLMGVSAAQDNHTPAERALFLSTWSLARVANLSDVVTTAIGLMKTGMAEGDPILTLGGLLSHCIPGVILMAILLYALSAVGTLGWYKTSEKYPEGSFWRKFFYWGAIGFNVFGSLVSFSAALSNSGIPNPLAQLLLKLYGH